MDGDSRPVILFFHCEIASYSILLQRNALYSKIHLRQKIPVIIFVRLMLLQFELNSLSLSLSLSSFHSCCKSHECDENKRSIFFIFSLARSLVRIGAKKNSISRSVHIGSAFHDKLQWRCTYLLSTYILFCLFTFLFILASHRFFSLSLSLFSFSLLGTYIPRYFSKFYTYAYLLWSFH